MKKKLIFTIILAVAMMIILIPVIQETKVFAVTLNNPKKDSSGEVIYDCVWFGSYPQSDATGIKKDPIKWRVLEVNNNRVSCAVLYPKRL